MAALRDSLTRHARAPVKAVLLNQAVVAGIGNIYADESLHHARIHPARRAGSLSLPDTRRLHAAIRAILHDAIETGGTSFAGYVNDFRGRPGYLDHAEVFRRQGQPCQACGTMIVRTRVAAVRRTSARAARSRRPGQSRPAPSVPRTARPQSWRAAGSPSRASRLSGYGP